MSQEENSNDHPAPSLLNPKRQNLRQIIGLTGYGSSLIYEVAELRKFLDTHSYSIRKSLYNGKPAQKTVLGFLKKNRPVIEFNGDELAFRQLGVLDQKPNGMLLYNVTGNAIFNFLQENSQYIGVDKNGKFGLKIETKGLRKIENSFLFQKAEKTLEWAKDVSIVAFDDRFSDSELVYGIAINRSERRVSVVFRGSVFGNKDWPTNFDFGQISIGELTSRLKSGFITDNDVNEVANVKLHQGFANYLFADISNTTDQCQKCLSKFDKIVSVLETIYQDPQYADYQLVISGHSLGGALAQLMTFAVGSSEKCRNLFPSPVVGVTYASPSVGNNGFSEAMNELKKQGIALHIRITNEADLVPVGFFWYEQSGINFHVQEGKELKLGGFGNTRTLSSELRFNLFQCAEAHGVPSHTPNLFYEGNRKIWSRLIDDSFRAVEEGKALADIPDKRTYGEMTKIELQQELEKRGLGTTGTKYILKQRLTDDDRRMTDAELKELKEGLRSRIGRKRKKKDSRS